MLTNTIDIDEVNNQVDELMGAYKENILNPTIKASLKSLRLYDSSYLIDLVRDSIDFTYDKLFESMFHNDNLSSHLSSIEKKEIVLSKIEKHKVSKSDMEKISDKISLLLKNQQFHYHLIVQEFIIPFLNSKSDDFFLDSVKTMGNGPMHRKDDTMDIVQNIIKEKKKQDKINGEIRKFRPFVNWLR